MVAGEIPVRSLPSLVSDETLLSGLTKVGWAWRHGVRHVCPPNPEPRHPEENEMDHEFSDDYLDALWDALKRRLLDRSHDLDLALDHAHSVTLKAQSAEHEAEWRYEQAQRECDLVVWAKTQ
jgi:hypothetical protein